MHPYNPYRFFPPKFAALAARSEKLARLVHRRSELEVRDCRDDTDTGSRGDHDEEEQTYIDFRDAQSSIALTEAMLEQDFGIHITLRQDRLCPPVPNRINYIAWLQEIIDETQSTAQYISKLDGHSNSAEERPIKRARRQSEPIRVLDVGTGASCIYPVLGCALDDWTFVATDVDVESINAARAFVEDPRNQGISQATFTEGRRLDLHNRIHLCLRRDTDDILPSEGDLKSIVLEPIAWPHLEEGLLYHAVMCNPPFYRDRDEMRDCMEAKEQGPSAVCLGSESEMICEGGEAAFVIRIIDESVHSKERVLWFTSTLGKFVDLFPIVERLKEVKPESVLVTEFVQGRTKRWGIAWSFLPFRMNTDSWHSKILSLPALGPYNNMRFSCPIEIKSLHSSSRTYRMEDLNRWLQEFSLQYDRVEEDTLIVVARSKSWSRAARRAKMRGEEMKSSEACILCARLVLEANVLTPTWLYGTDKTTWESFFTTVLQGWTKRIALLECNPV
jgi:23S rRNA (adenine1618-N6)-methyltransferase